MYVCIYVYMDICIRVYTYVCMYVCIYPYMYICIYERLSKLLVHGQTMDDLGGSYRFTRIPSHVSVRYRFALVKVRRPSDSLILLVACPALYCPLLPFTALYCLLLSFTCPLLPFTALHCLLLPFTCPLRPFTALYCPSLPFTALYCMGQWLIKRSGRYRLGYRLGID